METQQAQSIPSPRTQPVARVVEVRLEALVAHGGRGAVLGAALGSAGGPVYRFVATAPDAPHAQADHTAVSKNFPLRPFQELDEAAADEWTTRARQRLDDLDGELTAAGWQRLPEAGAHWWSLRYRR